MFADSATKRVVRRQAKAEHFVHGGIPARSAKPWVGGVFQPRLHYPGTVILPETDGVSPGSHVVITGNIPALQELPDFIYCPNRKLGEESVNFRISKDNEHRRCVCLCKHSFRLNPKSRLPFVEILLHRLLALLPCITDCFARYGI